MVPPFWRRPSRPVPRERKPQRNRSGRFLLLTLGSGAIAALLALAIEGIPVVMSQLTAPGSPPQLDAANLFPTPSPQHKTVDVYDPAPRGTGGEHAGPSPSPRNTPRPSPSPGGGGVSPRPTPSPDT